MSVPVAALVAAVFWLISKLPARLAYALGEACGRVAYQVAWIIGRNHIGMTNLHIVFGREAFKGQFRGILKAMWINLGMNLVEFARLAHYDEENISRYVVWENFHALEDVRARGRGIITITAHFGNWDLLALASSLSGLRVNLITKKMHSRALSAFWMKWRSRGGVRPIFKKDAPREIVSLLRRNELVAFVIDQDTKPKESGIFVRFFGREASTLSAPAILSQKYLTPVVPVFMVRQTRAVHRAFVEEPIEFESVGEHQADIRHNTRRYLEVLERYIRRYPEQWLWVHRRWRRRPSGEPPMYTGPAARHKRRRREGVWDYR